MNTRQIVAAAALALLGSSAFAGGEFDPMTGFNLDAAPAKTSAKAPAAPAAGLTREQVKAEFLASRNEDKVEFDRGNDFAKAPQGTSRGAAETRFAAARAAKRGS